MMGHLFFSSSVRRSFSFLLPIAFACSYEVVDHFGTGPASARI